MRRRVLILLAALIVLAAGSAAYGPGLNGPFLFDDGANLVNNPSVSMDSFTWDALTDAALSKAGAKYIHRPIPRVTFALNYYFGGQRFEGRVFKITNLVIHLINGGLVLWLSLLLMGCARIREKIGDVNLLGGGIWSWFPVVVAAVWTLHPIQLTSVLYVVQRMTSLAGLAVLLGLIIFVVGRLRVERGQRLGFTLMTAGLAGGTLLGVMCKENAVLAPLFGCLLELFFFSSRDLEGPAKFRLRVFYGVLVGAMILGVIVILLAIPDLLVRLYIARPFTPLERLMTQPRVLIYYLRLLLFPSLREYSLYHDDIDISIGLWDPMTTMPSLLFLATALVAALATIKRRSVLAFGVLWFLAGHAVESTILGLELVHEHRNYVPSFGVLFTVVFYVFVLASKRSDLRRLVVVMGAVFLAVLLFVTHTRASAWASLDELIFFAARNHPNSYRALMEKGRSLTRNGADVKDIYAVYVTAAKHHPQIVNPVMRMLRFSAGWIHNLKEEGMIPEKIDLEAGLARWDDPIFANLAYLLERDELIATEFTRRLIEAPMNAELMLSLAELQRCVTSRIDACPSFERVDKWVTMTADDKPMVPLQRAGLLLTQARLRAFQGDIEAAVEMTEEAFIQSGRREVGFLIELAQLFRILKDFDNADIVVELIGEVVEKTGRRSSDYKRLKEYLALERAEFETQQ